MTSTCSGRHGCGKSWGGTRAEHCTVCHETFSGATSGDKHRRNGACLDPTEIGLHLDGKGVWRFPAPEDEIKYGGAA